MMVNISSVHNCFKVCISSICCSSYQKMAKFDLISTKLEMKFKVIYLFLKSAFEKFLFQAFLDVSCRNRHF